MGKPGRLRIVTCVFGASLALTIAGIRMPAATGAEAPATVLKPPLVSTGYVPEWTDTTATLRGGVNPRGSETNYYFEYGPSLAYGARTPSASAGAGSQEVKVIQAVNGLTGYTSYHYRLVAANVAGTSVGQDRVFTTKKTPLGLSLAASRSRVLYGSRFAVSGTVSGTEASNQLVALQADSFPYTTGFSPLSAPQHVDAMGRFWIPVQSLKANSQLRVVTVGADKVFSNVILEQVALRVSLHTHRLRRQGYRRLYGTVSPADPGETVAFQWMRRGMALTLASCRVRRVSTTAARYACTVRIRHKGRYRAYVHSGDGKVVSHYSRTITLH